MYSKLINLGYISLFNLIVNESLGKEYVILILCVFRAFLHNLLDTNTIHCCAILYSSDSIPFRAMDLPDGAA